MKSKWMLAVLAVGLLAAVAALAADAPRKAPAQPAHPGAAMHDGAPGDLDAAHPDFEGDDDDLFAMGGRGRGPMGGRGRGPGMGRGPGGEGCDDACGMGPGGGRGMGMGRGMGRGMGMGPGGMAGMFAGLDLSDAQRDKLRDLHQRQARKGVQARADLALARMDLHELMQADKPDAAAINAQIDKLARLQAEQRKAQVATLLEARSLLTPEQQKQLRERHLRGPGMGMRGGARPPQAPEDGAKRK